MLLTWWFRGSFTNLEEEENCYGPETQSVSGLLSKEDEKLNCYGDEEETTSQRGYVIPNDDEDFVEQEEDDKESLLRNLVTISAVFCD